MELSLNQDYVVDRRYSLLEVSFLAPRQNLHGKYMGGKVATRGIDLALKTNSINCQLEMWFEGVIGFQVENAPFDKAQ